MRADWLLDLGHTRLKLARRRSDGGLDSAAALAVAGFEAWLDARPEPRAADRFWCAAVPAEAALRPIRSALEARGLALRQIVTGAVDLPVAPSYPGLGVDRWLAVQPVWQRLGAAFCVVDCGSAITLDLVDCHGRHRGGWIAPGPATARAGLLARAPGLERTSPAPDLALAELGPATDTALAIERGLWLQQAGLVWLGLAQARALPGCEAAVAVLTGGDALRLHSALQAVKGGPGGFGRNAPLGPVEPDLVLQGLAMAVEGLQDR